MESFISLIGPFIQPAIIALAPMIVKWLTDLIKSFESIKFSENRAPVLRLAAAFMALLASITHVWAFGGAIDEGAITMFFQTVAEAVLFYWSASGIYLLKKARNEA